MSKTNTISLRFFGLPIIQDLEDFSNLTHVSKYTLFQLSKYSEKYYKVYTIPKKSGKLRTISQPSKKLKGLQSWILHNILYRLNVSPSCKGFATGTSTKDNVEPHKYSNAVLAMDIKDFFPAIERRRVYNVFKSVGYNSLISTILTNLCTFNEALPQGSPCSPRLANLITWRLDNRIQHFVGKKGITYTRYADDLTFSSLNPIKIVQIISTIDKIIVDEGFKINKAKTRVAGASRQKKITGLVLSDDGFGIGNTKAKQLRSKIFHLTKPAEQKNFKLLNEVIGWLNYLKSVDTKRLSQLKVYIEKLKKKYSTTLIVQLK